MITTLGVVALTYHSSYAQSINFDSAHIVGTKENVIAHRVPVQDPGTGQVILYDVSVEFQLAADGSPSVKSFLSTKSTSQLNSADNFIPGTYADVNNKCYIVTAGGTTADGRTTGAVRSDSQTTIFNANWISGPVQGHPILSTIPEADQFQDGPNYGTAGLSNVPGFCNGGITGAIQAGSGITITAYHVARSTGGTCDDNPNDNPTTPFGRATLTLTPVADTASCDRN
jgi:hypothetical protein